MENKTPSAASTAASPQPPRRSFLYKFCTVVVSAFVGLAPLAAGVAVFFDPLRSRGGKKQAGNWLRIASLDAVPDDGVPRQFPVIADQVDAWNRTPSQPVGSVYLRRLPGESTVECLNAICPHAGCFVAVVAAGSEKRFGCPCHTSSFKLSGEKLDLPGATNPSPRAMDTLDVDQQRLAESGEVWVDFKNFYPGKAEKKEKA